MYSQQIFLFMRIRTPKFILSHNQVDIALFPFFLYIRLENDI